MTRSWRTPAAAASLFTVLVWAPLAAQQQDTIPAVPDTVPAPADTVPPPTFAHTRDADVPAGPLPPGTRVTLTRDSLTWTSAFTLADLLNAMVPGVYIARGGFWGQPEYMQYGGRGGSALEVYWDGLPLEPLGQDSLFLDPGRVPLSYLERVDIEVWPARILVHLVSERHRGLAANSRVRVVSGPFQTGAYSGLFQHRWPSGVGVDLAADFLGTDGASGPGRSDQFFDVWAKLSWVPSPRAGMSYQLRRQAQERPPVTAGGATGVQALQGHRSDFVFTLFSEAGGTDDAVRFEGGMGVSRWQPDSGFAIEAQEIRQAFGALAYERASLNALVEGRLADRRTLGSVRGRLGWVPFPGLVLAGNASWLRHEGDRTSRGAHGAARIYVGPASLVADVTVRDAVQAPALAADTAVRTTDTRVRAALDMRPFSGAVALVRRDAYDPIAYPALSIIRQLPSVPPVTYLVAEARLRPSSALSIGAWYSNPVTDTTLAGLQPPTHTHADITLRSKFWRTFRSGAFDLMVQLSMESWSTGTAGFDGSGGSVILPGATFWHMFVQFQIVGFTAFWDFRNARLTDAQYVPGLPYARLAQTYGVIWEFRN